MGRRGVERSGIDSRRRVEGEKRRRGEKEKRKRVEEEKTEKDEIVTKGEEERQLGGSKAKEIRINNKNKNKKR